MPFEVLIKSQTDASQLKMITVDAPHWHNALKLAFQELSLALPAKLEFEVAEDESFVVARETGGDHLVEIRDTTKQSDNLYGQTIHEDSPVAEGANKATLIDSAPFHAESLPSPADTQANFEPQISSSVPSIPEVPKLESMEVPAANQIDGDGRDTSRYLAYDDEDYEGMQYQTGMTTEILAEAFMRAMDIYDHGSNIHAAMNFVLELALQQLLNSGGGVLLTDPNNPSLTLWYEVPAGRHRDLLSNTRVPLGQGAVGTCAKDGASFIVYDMSQDDRFTADHLFELGINVGPLICAPIQNDGKCLGAIQLYREHGGATFTQGELSILNYLAHIAGEYLSSLGDQATQYLATQSKTEPPSA